jgi:hypothetical protein
MQLTDERKSERDLADVGVIGKSKTTLREAQFTDDDLRGIWNLVRSQFETYRTCTLSQYGELCRQLWLNNPARTPEHVFGWVLQDREDGIVGFIGVLPVKLKLSDGEVIGGAGHSWVVSPGYRAHSLSLYKQLMSWVDKHFLVTTTSRDLPGKIHQLFRMNKIPVANFTQQAFWLFKPEVVLKWALGKSEWNAWGSWIEQFPVGILLQGISRAWFIQHQYLKFKCSKMPVEPVLSFGEEFDELWESNKKDYGITTVRDQAFLTWRHLQIPSVFGKTFVFACRDGGRIRGYVAVQVRRQDAGCLPGHYVVTDLFYERACKDVLYNLMNHVFEFAKSNGCSALEASDFSNELVEELKRQRPYIRKSRPWTYWYKAHTEAIAELCEKEAWWPSGVDGDSNL